MGSFRKSLNKCFIVLWGSFSRGPELPYVDTHRLGHAHAQMLGDPGIRRIGSTLQFASDPDFPRLRFFLIASGRPRLSRRAKAPLQQFIPEQLVRLRQIPALHPQCLEVPVLEQTFASQHFLFELPAPQGPPPAHFLERHFFLRSGIRGQPLQIRGVASPTRRGVGQLARVPQRSRRIEKPGSGFRVTQIPVARPAVAAQSRYVTYTGPHRIEMHVMQQRPQIRVFLHDQTLEPPLKELPVYLPVAVVAIRESRQQPLHTPRQVPPGRANHQMEVVRHYAKALQNPAGLFAGFEQTVLKRPVRPFVHEQVLPVVPAVDHVVHPVFPLNS